MPVVTSWVVVALTWQWLLSPANGLVNHWLSLVGIHGPGWWASTTWAMPAVILASVWKDIGFVMVILLVGLKAIPQDLLDAARVDGASAWTGSGSVTFPLLSPATYFVVVISLINGFQVFDQVYVMTGGGPNNASQTLVLRYLQPDVPLPAGRARVGTVVAAVRAVLAVTVVQSRLQKRWVDLCLGHRRSRPARDGDHPAR